MSQLQDIYDALVQFASKQGDAVALKTARDAYVARTGDLFESDDGFERRIVAFLEWYTLDGEPPAKPPIAAFTESCAPTLDDAGRTALYAWRHASMSLFEMGRPKAQQVVLDDLLLSQKHVVAPTPALVGLASGSLVAGRVVTVAGQGVFTDGVSYFPPEARRVLRRIGKAYRKGRVPGVSRLDLVHRLIYLTNRCERYRHVDPKKIFTEGEAFVMAPGQSP